MDLNAYRFTSRWDVPAPRDRVFEVLADLRSYPRWWPQVRSVQQVDDDAAEVVCRSTLPYDLRFRSVRVREDRNAGVLEARLVGDLDGWSRWTLPPVGSLGTLLYEQQVVVHKELLRRLALVARPLFVANHTLMMRSGERGLRRHIGVDG